MLSSLRLELLTPVISKDLPREADFAALDNLAAAIAQKHEEHNLIYP